MNIFILNTGRCGSTTFIKACQHISNFTSAHESLAGQLREARFNYPKNHIEADNRLAWFLGKLDKYYGNSAIYVHLKRNPNNTAISFVNRYDFGIIKAYRNNILMGLSNDTDPLHVSLDYCDTVNSNIDLFLKNKSYKIDFYLENAKQDFPVFWNWIKAEGDINAALKELDISYNSTINGKQNIRNCVKPQSTRYSTFILKTTRKINRIGKKLPSFIKSA